MENGGDVGFFTPLSDKYRILVTYYMDEKKYAVGADDNEGGGAKFEFFVETSEHIDSWCSDGETAVEQYFKNAIDDPAVEHIFN